MYDILCHDTCDVCFNCWNCCPPLDYPFIAVQLDRQTELTIKHPFSNGIASHEASLHILLRLTLCCAYITTKKQSWQVLGMHNANYRSGPKLTLSCWHYDSQTNLPIILPKECHKVWACLQKETLNIRTPCPCLHNGFVSYLSYMDVHSV